MFHVGNVQGYSKNCETFALEAIWLVNLDAHYKVFNTKTPGNILQPWQQLLLHGATRFIVAWRIAITNDLSIALHAICKSKHSINSAQWNSVGGLYYWFCPVKQISSTLNCETVATKYDVMPALSTTKNLSSHKLFTHLHKESVFVNIISQSIQYWNRPNECELDCRAVWLPIYCITFTELCLGSKKTLSHAMQSYTSCVHSYITMATTTTLVRLYLTGTIEKWEELSEWQ